MTHFYRSVVDARTFSGRVFRIGREDTTLCHACAFTSRSDCSTVNEAIPKICGPLRIAILNAHAFAQRFGTHIQVETTVIAAVGYKSHRGSGSQTNANKRNRTSTGPRVRRPSPPLRSPLQKRNFSKGISSAIDRKSVV